MITPPHSSVSPLEQTRTSFHYPDTLIKRYKHWLLLLRPKQVTVGSLVLVCDEEVTQFSQVSEPAAREYPLIVKDIETVLAKRFSYSKINYLMLMMVDPAVHFHIIPRYENGVEFLGQYFEDKDWPGPPNLSQSLALNPEQSSTLLVELRDAFETSSDTLITQKKYQKVYTSGCFDIFHQGHLNILKRSKDIADVLVVGVSTDELIEKEKGRKPLIPFEERVEIIKSLSCVDEVIPQKHKNKQQIVDEHSVDAITVGSDWKGSYPEVSCELIYFDYTENVSSTKLKESLFALAKNII